jgi:hypothetical protein
MNANNINKLQRKYLENVCNPSSTNFHSRLKCSLNMPRVLQWAFKYGPGITYGQLLLLRSAYTSKCKTQTHEEDTKNYDIILRNMKRNWITQRKMIVLVGHEVSSRISKT